MFSRGVARAVAVATLFAALPASADGGAITVAPTRIEDRKAVYATVESADTLVARARIGGTVGGLSVDEGDRVKADEVIAVVGDPKLMLQLQSIDARISSLRAELNQAQTDYNRTETLYKQGVVAKARLDQANTQVQVLTRNLASLRAERSVTEQQSDEGAVKAPGAGRVLDVQVVDGTVIMPGEVIATIASGTYVLRMEVPERHARFIKTGDSVLIGRRGLDRQQGDADLRQGEVVQVYPRLSQGRVVADVRADGLGDYFVGERAVVYVATGEREVFVLPESHLFTRYGVTYVTLQDGTDVVVQTGGPVQGGIEILSGLREGDVVVAPGSTQAVAPAAGGER